MTDEQKNELIRLLPAHLKKDYRTSVVMLDVTDHEIIDRIVAFIERLVEEDRLIRLGFRPIEDFDGSNITWADGRNQPLPREAKDDLD